LILCIKIKKKLIQKSYLKEGFIDNQIFEKYHLVENSKLMIKILNLKKNINLPEGKINSKITEFFEKETTEYEIL
jgi:hypothetical protein